jgi:hypothetical protein
MDEERRYCGGGGKKKRNGRKNRTSREGTASEDERRLKLLSFSVVLPRAFHSRAQNGSLRRE